MQEKNHRRHTDRQRCTDCGALGQHEAGCPCDLSAQDVDESDLEDLDGQSFFWFRQMQERRDAA